MADLLTTLKQELSDWNPQLQPAQGTGSVPHLFVTVGGMTGTIAQISAAQKMLGAEPLPDGVEILQIFVQLPVEMEPDYFAETAQLISIINARIPSLGFIANPKDKKVAFRYMHLISPDKPNLQLLDEALSNLDIVLDIFGDAIRDVATGKRTYEVAVQSLPE